MKGKRKLVFLSVAILLTVFTSMLFKSSAPAREFRITSPSIQALCSYIEASSCTCPVTGIERTMYYLKKGDIYPLAGISFGDSLDYEQFERCGDYYYRRNEDKRNLGYFFEGDGLGFSGLILHGYEQFLRISIKGTGMDRLIPFLGEPDMVEESGEGKSRAYWQYEKAVISVNLKEDIIMSLEYHAREGVADRERTPEEETELGRDRMQKGVTEETVYQWMAAGSKSSPDGSYAFWHPYNDGYEEDLTEDFIKYYLQTQDIHKDAPDGVSYNRRGEPLIEYYIDEQKEQYCFIVHLWGEYWVDYEAGISKYQDAVYCTTHYLEEEDKIGYLLHNWDEEERIIRERQYDLYGKQMADLSYEYQENLPFPFVTSFWEIGGYHAPTDVAGSGQKFWFHKERACFDENGRWTGLKEGKPWEDEKEYFPFESTCIYGADGKLKEIREELLDEDREDNWGWKDGSGGYSGQITFVYDENGTAAGAEYKRSFNAHGSGDSSGTIEYDKKGRMIYNDYYVTHGGDTELFLYEEDSRHPWACFHWCSFAPGFINIYVFRSEQ